MATSEAAAFPPRARSALQLVAQHLTGRHGWWALPASGRPFAVSAAAEQANLAQLQTITSQSPQQGHQGQEGCSTASDTQGYLHSCGSRGASVTQQASRQDASLHSTPYVAHVGHDMQASQLILHAEQQHGTQPQQLIDVLQRQLDLVQQDKDLAAANWCPVHTALGKVAGCAGCFTANQAMRALYLMVKLDVALRPAFMSLHDRLHQLQEWWSLPVSNLVLFCWCCARTNFGTTQVLKEVIQVLLPRCHEMNAQDVAMMSWCVARQRWYHSRDPMLLLVLQSASARVAGSADSMAASMLAWTSSTLPQLDAGSSLTQLLQSAILNLSSWDMRTLAAVIYTAAKNRHQHQGLLEQTSEHILSRLQPPPAPLPQAMHTSHVIRLFWGLCVLERHASHVVQRVASHLVRLASDGKVTPRQVGMIVDGCKAAGWRDDAFLSKILPSLASPCGHAGHDQLSMLSAITLSQQLAELQYTDDHHMVQWIDSRYRQMAQQALCINDLVALTRMAAHQPGLPNALWRDLVEEVHHAAIWYPEAWQGKDVTTALQALGRAMQHGYVHAGLQHWVVRALLDLATAHVDRMSVEELCLLCRTALQLRCLPSDVLHRLLRRLLARHMDTSPHARQELVRMFCWWGGVLSEDMLEQLVHALKRNARQLRPADAASVAWSSMHMHQLHSAGNARVHMLLDQLCSELGQTLQLQAGMRPGKQLTA